MKDTAPTIEEMREVIHTFEMLSFKELQAQGIFDDKRKMIITKPMTYILMSHTDDTNKEKIWKYWKKIGIRSLMGRIKWSRWKDIITP